MRAASKSRGVTRILVRPALWFCACNLLAAALGAQCLNPTQVPNQTISSGSPTFSDNNALSASNVTINGGASVTFVAGNCIQLLPGFHATAGTAGTTFHAWVETAPAAVSVSPASGSGLSQPFTWTVSSPSGYGNLSYVLALFNTSPSGANACYIQYSRSSNVLYLADNTGANWLGGFVPGSSGSASNSYCSIYGSGSSVSASGTQLALTVSVTFQTSFSGTKNEYLYAQDNAGLYTGYQWMGTWTVAASQQYYLTTAVSPSGGGSASPASGWYNSGSPVTITATPASGYQFNGFTGSVNSGSNPLTVTMNSAMTETANFTQTVTQYQLTTGVSPSGGGTVSPSCPGGCSYSSGSQVTITATPASGCQFNGFTGSVNSGSNPLTVTMNGAMSETANFTPVVTQYQLTTGVSPSVGGTVSPSCPGGCSYNSGSPVTLTAQPNAGFAFSSFSGSMSGGSNPLVFNMNSAITETANFTTQVPTVTAIAPTSGPTGTLVTISGAGFGATQGSSTVAFAGTPAVITSWSQTGTSMIAQVPAGATTGVVTVAISGFAPAASTAQFVPAPNGISSLSLTQGPPQVGFVITGSGFPANPAVTLNGTPLPVIAGQVTTCSSPSATCIAVQVPQNMAQGGPWPVVVSGVPSNGATFKVTPAFGCAL